MKQILSIAGALALVLVACKTTGVDQAETTSQNMLKMKSGLAEAPAKIEGVTTALAELREEGGDMQAEYAAYSDNVDSLLAHRDHLRGIQKSLEKNKEAFTMAWETRLEAIQDPGMRERSEERLADVRKDFSDLSELGDEVRAEFEPWMQKNLDLRTYLESDLNPSGVDSVDGDMKKVIKDAKGITKGIEKLLAEFEDLATAIAATKPPPPPAE